MNKKLFYLQRQNLKLGRITKKWVKKGCPAPPPQMVKIHQILAALKTYNLNIFIETGTLHGDTLEMVARTGVKCWSVELSDELFNFSTNRLRNYKNVQIINDDSAKAIPEILIDLDEPAFFWLDGHYSGAGTALGDKVTPVSEEILAIMGHHIKSHVIYIDDARLFNGEDEYPVMADFLTMLTQYEDYIVTISCDSIRITPR